MKEISNPAGAADAPITFLFGIASHRRRATDQHRWAMGNPLPQGRVPSRALVTRSATFVGVIALACVLALICSSCSKSDARKHFNAGTKKSASGDYSGAIADYDKAIQMDPSYAKAYNNRGIAKDALKDEAGAVADYTKAIELNPQYQFAYYNRGNSEQELRDYTNAIRDYDKAASLDLRTPQFF